jgi:cytochrome o ubiquinol oxidase subunit 1
MPKNTAAGIILAGLSTVCGFALIWHIWWLVVVAFVAAIATAVGHTFNYQRDFYIPADAVNHAEAERTALLGSHG